MLPATLRRAQRNPRRIADKRSRRAFGPGHPFKQRLERRVHLDGGKIPAPIMARKHPSEPAVGHRLRDCRCPEHDDSRYIGGASRSSVSKFQASASAVSEGNAGREDRRRRLCPHGRSHQATRERRKYTPWHSHRRHRRDGTNRGPSDIAFCPFAQSQRPDKACAPSHGKGCGSPCA